MRRFYVLQDGEVVGTEPHLNKVEAQRAANAHRMMLRQFVDAGWLTRGEYAEIEVTVGRVDIPEGPTVREAASVKYSVGTEAPTVAEYA